MRRRAGIGLWLALAACGGGASVPPPVELADAGSVDLEVRELAAQKVQQARAEPRDAERRAELAMVYEANELWDEADRAWAQALALDPARPLWRYHRARCARQAGQVDQAQRWLEEVVRELPDLAAARLALGEMLLEAEDLVGARRELEACVALAPLAAPAWCALAELALREEEPRAAEDHARKALDLAPDDKRAHYVLGLALRDQGRMEEARVELQRGLEAKRVGISDPLSDRIAALRRSYTVRVIEAGRLAAEGKHAEAARLLESVLERHPDDVTALSNLSATYIELGRPQDAIGLLERAERLDPEQFSIPLNRAAALLALRRYQESLEAADRAVSLGGSVGQTWFVRARAKMALGRWNEAYADLRRAIELDANQFLFRAVAGDAAIELGLLPEAVEHYRAALRLKADHLPAWTRLSWALLQLGRRDEALAAYEQAQRLAPDHKDVATLARELGLR